MNDEEHSSSVDSRASVETYVVAAFQKDLYSPYNSKVFCVQTLSILYSICKLDDTSLLCDLL